MTLVEFEAVRDGAQWTGKLWSARSSLFLADLTTPVGPEHLGSNGFSMEDSGFRFASGALSVTLFSLPQYPAWIGGLLVTTEGVDLTAVPWASVPAWNGEPERFCLDSGIAVLGTAESLDSVTQLRNSEQRWELVRRMITEPSVVEQAGHIRFVAPVNCFDCWGLREPGSYQAIYVDLGD